MRFLVLSRQRHLYSTRRFREVARRRGHGLGILDPLACTLAIGGSVHPFVDSPARLFDDSREVHRADCVIPRIGAALGGHSLAVVSHFEVMGVPVLNDSRAIGRARDKLVALQLLARAGIDVPATVMIGNRGSLERVLEIVGGPPVVLKLLQGTQGVGVILAESRAAIAATLDTLWGLGQHVLIQEFVAESRGCDVRALVIGGQVVAAMRRVAGDGEWRANLHRGGSAERIHLEDAYARVATHAARAVGLEVAGVDLLESRRGPKVVEINASPGFEGLERVTGIDVAGAILTRAESFAGRQETGSEDTASSEASRGLGRVG
ncbi:MAG TPA: RimK family alpha-L-glutamate ligase [Gemmatimonadota bacterium]|nr:RimK family alpha-L-glutamate ligase [Gemmatimonadota bacterium]